MSFDKLKQELKKVESVAVKLQVNHTNVAKAAGISYTYLGMIRKGKRLQIDSAESRAKYREIIACYRSAINAKKRFLAAC